MDINGFILHVNVAITKDLVYCEIARENKPDFNYEDMRFVTLKSLQQEFSVYDSWSELKDPESKFVKLLEETCTLEN